MQIKHRYTGVVLWEGESLQNADLQHALLQHADLRSADLQHANLRSADLRSADLRSADLQYTNLQGANLQGANLQGANLQGANLQGADLRSVCLQGAKGAPVLVLCLPWRVLLYSDRVHIGCMTWMAEQFDTLTAADVSTKEAETWGPWHKALVELRQAIPVPEE